MLPDVTRGSYEDCWYESFDEATSRKMGELGTIEVKTSIGVWNVRTMHDIGKLA